jgi:hypothetical protein
MKHFFLLFFFFSIYLFTVGKNEHMLVAHLQAFENESQNPDVDTELRFVVIPYGTAEDLDMLFSQSSRPIRYL